MGYCILAIETSCDETAAAVIAERKVLSNVIASQQEHHRWGGIVPEIARARIWSEFGSSPNRHSRMLE